MQFLSDIISNNAILGGLLGAVGISALFYKFLDRILVQIICRLFPSFFINNFTKIIRRLNDYLDNQKKKSKFPKSFTKIETELVEMLQESVRILKK